jgi:hypothetical protein
MAKRIGGKTGNVFGKVSCPCACVCVCTSILSIADSDNVDGEGMHLDVAAIDETSRPTKR